MPLLFLNGNVETSPFPLAAYLRGRYILDMAPYPNEEMEYHTAYRFLLEAEYVLRVRKDHCRDYQVLYEKVLNYIHAKRGDWEIAEEDEDRNWDPRPLADIFEDGILPTDEPYWLKPLFEDIAGVKTVQAFFQDNQKDLVLILKSEGGQALVTIPEIGYCSMDSMGAVLLKDVKQIQGRELKTTKLDNGVSLGIFSVDRIEYQMVGFRNTLSFYLNTVI